MVMDMTERFVMWGDYDALCNKVETTLQYIEERSGLINKETAENVSTDIIAGLIESHPNSISSEDIDKYIVEYFKSKLESSVEELIELTSTKNTLFLVSIMHVLGFDIQNIATVLGESIEEVEYAMTIITDNKIVN